MFILDSIIWYIAKFGINTCDSSVSIVGLDYIIVNREAIDQAGMMLYMAAGYMLDIVTGSMSPGRDLQDLHPILQCGSPSLSPLNQH